MFSLSIRFFVSVSDLLHSLVCVCLSVCNSTGSVMFSVLWRAKHGVPLIRSRWWYWYAISVSTTAILHPPCTANTIIHCVVTRVFTSGLLVYVWMNGDCYRVRTSDLTLDQKGKSLHITVGSLHMYFLIGVKGTFSTMCEHEENSKQSFKKNKHGFLLLISGSSSSALMTSN